ncbi:MAG: preprotein translocase subunit SecY [Chloroflexi bacterium]|nr:preprotein translocase subunit SecY [Chloroflexota bacterium]
MFEALINAFRAPDIRRRILFVLGMLVVFRFLAHVPVPGVDREALEGLLSQQQFLQLLNLFSGGGLANFSIVAMGVNPYINASIIMQLMTGTVPRLQQLSREGEYGRNKINQYTRYLTVPLAFLQAYGYLALLSAPGAGGGPAVITNFDLTSISTLTQMFTLAAGTILTMWIGELITERGIGNGISFIIFAGIVSQLPAGIQAFMESPDLAAGLAFLVLAIIAVAVIVHIQEGQRRIPIQYASRVRGRRMYQGGATFLPLRVNQAGVIPIIFAISILLFPTQIASYFSNSEVDIVRQGANAVIAFLDQNGLAYAVIYFLLTVGFTFFYTAFTFKPDETADQLRKNGGFIPGIRPGSPTREYLARVVFRISLAGALFLGIVAVSPILVAAAFRTAGGGGVLATSFGLGGTALLIVVSVVVETMKQLEAQLMMRNYEGFIR